MEKANSSKKSSFTERVAGTFDAFIGFFNPKAGYQRRAMRKATKMLDSFSAYRGADFTRLNNDWVTRGDSPDQSLLPELPTLRQRSRWLNRNDAHAAGITKAVVTNVVGTGIKPQCRPDVTELGLTEEEIKQYQKQAERAWERWCPFADAGERMHFYEIQNLVQRQILENGEVFINPIRIKDKNRPYRLALDIIEADRVHTPNYLLGNKSIRDGIKIGDRGQPLKYYVRKGHPGDVTYGKQSMRYKIIEYNAKTPDGKKNILHLYKVDRPGQTRGVPFFAPVLNYFKDFADYLEAEIVTARIAACFSIFITKTDAYEAAQAATAATDTNGKRHQEMEPGTVTWLEPGESVTTSNPNRGGQTFEPFVFVMLRSIATALGLPYELVTKDFSRTNFSSARAALLQAYRLFREWQEWLNRNFNKPVWDMVIEEAFLNGDIDAKDFMENKFDYCRVKWIAPGWEWVDPLKEAKASEVALNNGVTTLADECAAQGKDVDEVLDQRAKENVRIKELEEKHKIKLFGEKKEQTKTVAEMPEEDEEAGAPNKEK